MKKILIVEDNKDNFELFCGILFGMDLEIIHAKNGREAVDICLNNIDISLVLMDMNMPVMNGEDATVLIKTNNPNINIISNTAYVYTSAIKKENRKYFSEFIEKPINVKLLKTLVKKYCFDEN